MEEEDLSLSHKPTRGGGEGSERFCWGEEVGGLEGGEKGRSRKRMLLIYGVFITFSVLGTRAR
jgi:hypothetical protein